MPFRTIPNTTTRYGLISFDAKGRERTDDPDGLMSQRLIEIASTENITNVFLFSHGWMGDVPGAIDQYDRWIGAFDNLAADRSRATETFPNFKPLYVGLHWPSMPWGNEELGDGSFGVEDAPTSADLFNSYLERLDDTPEIRAALRTIIDDARVNAASQSLSEPVREAFMDLNEALGLASDGVGGPPDSDREIFDPDLAYDDSEASFGVVSNVFNGTLGVLRLCSYWTMKKRARLVGETGMHEWIKKLELAAPVRIHLMGHSFGCIVVSSILGGPGGTSPLPRPIDSVVLVQGALSLWSYSPKIPYGGAAGYFHPVIAGGNHKICGPLVTTRSRFDLAVGDIYPKASLLAQQVVFAAEEYPKYGAVGSFGFQGLPAELGHNRTMLPASAPYSFEKGKVYNLDANAFIKKGSPPAGAHADIDGPEVAHAIWEAAFASA